MLAGAIARAIAATAVHPLNVIKTMLQTEGGRIPELTWPALSRGMRGLAPISGLTASGAGSQLIMSIPHGALNFLVTETAKARLSRASRRSPICQQVPHKCEDLQQFKYNG